MKFKIPKKLRKLKIGRAIKKVGQAIGAVIPGVGAVVDTVDAAVKQVKAKSGGLPNVFDQASDTIGEVRSATGTVQNTANNFNLFMMVAIGLLVLLLMRRR